MCILIVVSGVLVFFFELSSFGFKILFHLISGTADVEARVVLNSIDGVSIAEAVTSAGIGAQNIEGTARLFNRTLLVLGLFIKSFS